MLGETWGLFIWGGATPVPLLSPLGIATLALALFAGGALLRLRRSGRYLTWLMGGALCLVPLVAFASEVSLPYAFSNGQVADADEVNENFNAVSLAVDDNDARIGDLEAAPQVPTDISCNPGSFMTGVGPTGNPLCGVDPGGDITAVTAGSGLTGGGASGAVSLSIAPGGVTSTLLGSNSVTAAKIAAGAVGNSQLAVNSVGPNEIGPGAVGKSEIGTDAVGSDEIEANAVGSDEIAANAVSTSEVLNDSLASNDLKDEPGVEWVGAGATVTTLSSGASVVIRSVTLDPPASGYAIVQASGSIGGNGYNVSNTQCGITTGTTVVSGDIFLAGYSISSGDQITNMPFSTSHVFSVTDAPATFRLVCKSFGVVSAVKYARMHALYVPTRY